MTRSQERDAAVVALRQAEAAFVVGDWDAAHALALVAAAGRDRSVALHGWAIARPIAAHRGDGATLRQLGAWLAAQPADLTPPSESALRAAMAVTVAIARGDAAPLPAADELRDAWAAAGTAPGDIAAIDTLLFALIDADRFDEVEAAIAARTDATRDEPPTLATGAALVWSARFGQDEAEIVVLARDALAALRHHGAAWWMEQAIGILDDAGAATPDEREERRGLRIRLLGDPPA